MTQLSICIKPIPIPSNVNLQKERAVYMSFTLEGHRDLLRKRPIPSKVNLQKEESVCMSFTLEGHGDHYEKRVMWCRGWTHPQQPAEGRARNNTLEGHGDLYVKRVMQTCSGVEVGQLRCRMLLGVVSLTTGSTTGVPMSPGYGGCQTATPPPYYTTTTYATTGSYTPLHENQSSEHIRHGNNCSGLSVTNFFRHRIAGSQPWLLHRGSRLLLYQNGRVLHRSGKVLLYPVLHNAVLTCYAEAALSCYVELNNYTDARVYYTTTFATPSYNTAALSTQKKPPNIQSRTLPESLFNLAVLDCVKPDIDQEPRWNSSATTAWQFQVQHSYFWITLQPHAAYNGSICLRHTFHHLAATR
ncbi:hypothetical protein DAPPUDRAFT_97988 [Daphnia pulex]|uniref:Uncharacterized protein n=1 Tax=Daphnia pulex TaxID=6669 RepID=E9G351_DAPPU|nr:hypothetical protein DAPPUDRAFT_97988 [Daphnia pulex]|eukprot:EFX86157.1 hypothetical protein DAPPUDRAFT_97988 [Daphnia pulex]